MAVFIVLWPYLLTIKLRCLKKNNIGHTKQQQGSSLMEAFLIVASIDSFGSSHFLLEVYCKKTMDANWS